MNEKNRRQGENIYIGGQAIGNAFGPRSTVGDVTVNQAGAAGSVHIEDLRRAIVSLRAEIDTAGDTAQASTEMLRYELDHVEHELGKDQPDGEAVRVGWTRALRLLGPLQRLGTVAQATDRIVGLIHTFFPTS